MIPENLNLSHYADWLFSLSERIGVYEESLPYWKHRAERLALVSYQLSKRTWISGLQSELSKRLIEAFINERKNLSKLIEDREEVEMYIGCVPQKLGFNYFLPDDNERDIIEWQRKGFFAQSIVDFQQKRAKWFRSSIELIDKELSDLAYNYEQFYNEGEPVRMDIVDKPREGIIVGLIQDFATYDYAQYLLNERSMPQNEATESIRPRLNWIASPTVLGFIIGELAQKGYINAPKKRDGDIDYKALAVSIINSFGGESANIGTIETLRKVVSPDDEKGLSPDNENRFRIPDYKEIANKKSK